MTSVLSKCLLFHVTILCDVFILCLLARTALHYFCPFVKIPVALNSHCVCLFSIAYLLIQSNTSAII